MKPGTSVAFPLRVMLHLTSEGAERARARYTRIKGMLGPAGELRVLGFRYRTVFTGLGLAAICLSMLLVFNIPPTKTSPQSPDFDEFLLAQLHAGWTRLLIIGTLLAITASAAILTAYCYSLTRDRLAKVQDMAQAILSSLAWGVLTLDTEGSVTVINRAASEMLELSADPSCADLDGITARHPVIGGLIRNALEKRQYAQDHDSVFVNSKNTKLVLRTTICEQCDEAGRRVGIIVLVKDVSKLVAMEEELRQRDRLATVGTLAAGVAHEVRNPLSALELNLRLLRDEIAELSPPRPDLAGYCEILSAEAKRLNHITSGFLQLARVEPLAKSLVRVREPIERVVRLLQTEAEKKGIVFHLDLTPDGAFVMGDAAKLEQVFLNILINAMQAMPSGGVVRISSAVLHNDHEAQVNLRFTDEGVGIAAENLPRLFDPYFTTRSDGTGLGLAITERIVTDHGGQISVESTVGKGSTVTVSLPLAASESVREQELAYDGTDPGRG